MVTKLSVSLPEADVRTLDAYTSSRPGATRSSALRDAIRLLREQLLLEQYDAATEESASSGEADEWDATAGDVS